MSIRGAIQDPQVSDAYFNEDRPESAKVVCRPLHIPANRENSMDPPLAVGAFHDPVIPILRAAHDAGFV
jgi:hypothetical protein